MSRSFAVTWDYRCPYARNAHEHIVAGLDDGADWDVEFVPFSLSQVHVEEGHPDVWDDPDKRVNLLAAEAGLVVRDKFPDAFRKVHLALFAARHDEARDIRERDVVRDVLDANGVDSAVVFDEIDGGGPLQAYKEAHVQGRERHKVFGVPTFIMGDRAVFVRITDRPQGDGAHARRSIERVLDLIDGAPTLNEFKHTSIAR